MNQGKRLNRQIKSLQLACQHEVKEEIILASILFFDIALMMSVLNVTESLIELSFNHIVT